MNAKDIQELYLNGMEKTHGPLVEYVKRIEWQNTKMREALVELRNGGCGRQRNQNFNGQNYRDNCVCCDVIRENIDEALSSLHS